ncbi:MAG: hypothetical protein IJN29_07760 [Akkermansia sp.]|nr:hypothetical protein [Akkermansia sp.]
MSEADSIEESEAFTESLIEDGYDGVYYDGDLRQEMMVFEPNQIKSATDNRGTFDGSNADITFSVIGPKAKTWDKYKHRAFTGRDDGMQRAEIDASRAKLKWEDLRGKNVAAYRRIVAGWDNLPEAERKQVETFAEQVYDWQDESQKLNSTPENEFLEQYNKVIKLRDTLKPQRAEIRTLLNKIFVEHGGGAAAVLNMKDAELDELALSLWGPYVESKVEDMLDLRPLWHGGMKLADVLEYPELYEAYPELADITVRYAAMDTARGRALYHDGEHEILINRNLEGEWRSIHSILLHEIQHHIQNIEGFAKGGNPMMARYIVEDKYSRRYVLQNEMANTQAAIAWLEGVEKVRREFLNLGDAIAMRMEKSRLENLRDKYNDLVYKYNKVAFRVEGYEADALDRGFMMPSLGGVTKAAYTKAAKTWENVKDRNAAFPGLLKKMRIKNDEQWGEWNELEKGKQKWGNLSSLELYNRLAGEIEARNVQARYGWSMDRREAIPFNSTLEFPGEALVTFSVSPTLRADIRRAAYNKMDAKEHVRLCTMPTVLRMLGEPEGDVYTLPGTISKLVYTHNLAHPEVYRAVEELEDPLFVFRDTEKSYLFVLEMQATNNKGEKSNVAVAIQLQRSESGHYLMSAYPLDALDKITKLEKLKALVYSKYTAQELQEAINKQATPPTADAPGTFKPDLLRAAVKDGLSEIVMTKQDIVKFNPPIFTASMEKASLRALDLLTIRADERAGEQLIKDWQAACENWGRFSREDAGRLGNGAKMLGEMQALIGATKGVLPERYCRMGHLNGLMRWASIYAKMQQDGTLPQVGEIKGPIYQKFLEKLQQADELNRLQGMSEQEAQEAMALLAGERLDTAMMKVARECRRRLELFLKDRELERIDHIVEKAYPKRQNGQKWPRGKMAADAYRRMERARQYMNLPADEVAERINDAKRKLDALDATDADFERKEEELEEEISLLQTFGCWENMGFEQARRACGVMTEMVLLGRAKWKEKLQAERRRANYDRAQISRNFRTKLADVQRKRAKTDAKEKARKRTIGKNLVMGSMSYSQLMLALEPKLGKEFTGRHMRMIAKAHERLQLGTQQLHRRMFSTLSEITGLKTEGEMEEWLKSNNEIIDTGIVLKPRFTETCRMTPEEVEEWLALSKAQREARRKQADEEAAAKGELPDNVPSEDSLERMREKLEASRKAGTTPKEYEVTVERRYESPLHCTKEAMLFAILTFEQEDYARLMDVNGVNEKALQRMRELVGDKLLRWGYAMRAMLNEQGLTMAAVYEAHTGVPFAKRANYFRGVFDIAKAKDKGESIDSATSITGGKYGCLIPRQYHHQMLNWSTSATQVFIGTYKEQQNYICTSHISREWRTLLSNQGFEKRLRAEIGDAALDMIHGWCKLIDGSVIADAKVNAMMNRLLGKVMGAYAVSRLAGNVYTIIKQVSAVLNGFVGGYVPEQVLVGDAVAQQLTYRHIGFGEYAAALARAMSGQTEISAEEIANAGFIAGRKRVQGAHLEEAAMLAPGQSVPGKVGRAGRAVYEANMDAIGIVDRKCNTLAALAVADAVYRAAKRENKDGLVSDAELRRVAIETAGMVIDRAAQPQLRTQKGYWAAGGGAFGAMGNFFYMFKSEVLGKLGLYVGQMFAGHHGAWIGGALGFGVLNSVVLALIDYVRGYWPGDDEEDKWKPAKQFVWNVFANDISAVPVLGDLEGWARSTVLGGRQWNSSLVDMVVPFKDMYTYGKREVKYISEDESWDKHVQALCCFARALGAAGGWWQGNSRVAVGSCAELALAVAAISNIVRFGKDAVKKVVGEEE